MWNCNGSLRLDVEAFEDSFKDRDIVFYSETHQALGKSLPKVVGFKWESVCRQESRSKQGNRGCGGVAVLFKEELQHLIQVTRRDEQARFMWVKIKADIGTPLHIAVCYLAPSTSWFASLKGQSPYISLEEDIKEFSREGDVIIAGDFNARTTSHQIDIFDVR